METFSSHGSVKLSLRWFYGAAAIFFRVNGFISTALDIPPKQEQDEDKMIVGKRVITCGPGSDTEAISGRFPGLTIFSQTDLKSSVAEVRFMVVTTQENGLEVLGLHVGAANVRRYFPKSMRAVELQLGDLRIQCNLGPDFWDGRPEICDPRLSAWLMFKVKRERPTRKPVSLALEHADGNAFTLRPDSLAGRKAIA